MLDQNTPYFCFNCGYTTEVQYIDDAIPKAEVPKEDFEFLCDFKQKDSNHKEILCEECTTHVYHTPICTLCGNYSDYCTGHGELEEAQFGDCPICELPCGPGADPEEHGDWCRWHSLSEYRDPENIRKIEEWQKT